MTEEQKLPEYRDYPYIHLEIIKYPYPDSGNLELYVMRVMDKDSPSNGCVMFYQHETIESQLDTIIKLAKELKMHLKSHQRTAMINDFYASLDEE